ncbi:hypothetical protein DYB28_011244 [Aphanomyces astaci]|uniref:Uncharacterized protein n=1 Tax=Aphanomyces astaci TaxID=112090 RepID=A0A397DZP8_APHAT|nr:hypothetical protein DYB30_006411 [Aphanomyces astaci]RHZ09876.1 hypothetical protein DYB26_009492 [Aphanomyces astaci]RLO03179.1 hypothetical protein DYB28_011244 [Aphanomyces astaci]
MANFEADYNDLTEVPLELVSLASLRTISLMYNGTAGSLQSLSPTLETLRLDGNPVGAVPPTMDVALLTSKRLRIQGTQPPVRSFTPCLLMPACHYNSPKLDLDMVGIAVSDCYGVVTGLEPKLLRRSFNGEIEHD